MRGIQRLLRESPFGPLQSHRDVAFEAGRLVDDLVDAFLDAAPEKVATAASTIAALEREADDLMNDIRGLLPSDVRLPISRRDFLMLLGAQDDVADSAKKLSALCVARSVVAHGAILAQLRELSGATARARDAAQELLLMMEDLVESSFGGPVAEEASAAMERTEHAAEDARSEADTCAQQLFREGESLKPVDLLLLLRIVEGHADLAKAAGHIASRMRLILAK